MGSKTSFHHNTIRVDGGKSGQWAEQALCQGRKKCPVRKQLSPVAVPTWPGATLHIATGGTTPTATRELSSLMLP